MYQPKHFQIDEPKYLRGLITHNALGTLVTVDKGTLNADHIPVVLDEDIGEFGRLRFHVARANPVASLLSQLDEVLFVFQGEQHYVSPDWYGDIKDMVPTWNYCAVHAYGKAQELNDDGLVDVLRDLSSTQEQVIMQKSNKAPWTADKMDQDLFIRMRRAIVGFQLPIKRLQGKWKMSQNRPDAARKGVIESLERLASNSDRDSDSDSDKDNARRTARTIQEFLPE